MILKTTFVLLMAYVTARCASRSSAAVRHAIIASGVVGALLLPVLTYCVPTWELPPGVVGVTPTVGSVTIPSPIPPADSQAAASGEQHQAPFSWGGFVFGIWMTGSLVSIAMLGIGVWRLRTLTVEATPTSAEWDSLVRPLAQQLGISRAVRTLLTSHPLAPLTWGYVTPCILLPSDALTWSAERRRVVVAHELAHIARGDWGMHLVTELLRAAYWFNPLVWLLCRCRRFESERACDDRVLALGVDGVTYAGELVDLARSRYRHRWLPAPAIVRASGLERRVRAMLNPKINRMSVTLRGRVTIAVCTAVLVVALAGVSVAQALATFAGSVVDPSNGVVPNVRLVLTNTDTEARIEVRSDRNGRFEFPPLLPGTYAVLVEYPGFSRLRSTLRLQAGERLEPNLQLEVSALEETLTVRDPGSNAAEMPRKQSAKPRPIRCSAGTGGDGQRIGGNIRPPARIENVSPVYPLNYRGSGRTEMVRLTAMIQPDGTIGDIQTVGSPLPEFEQAARDAVRQWAFDSTLLNCEPVEVHMQVHVYFAP